jgi:hypothetical protein
MKPLSRKDTAFIYNILIDKVEFKYKNLISWLFIVDLQCDNEGNITKNTAINLFFSLNKICEKDSRFNKTLEEALIIFENRKDRKIEKKKKMKGIKKVRR